MICSVCFFKSNTPLSLWLTSHWALWFLFNYGNKTVFGETIDTYPDLDRVNPRHLSFIWQPLKLMSDKSIPREMYFSDVFLCVVFIIYSVILFATNLKLKILVCKFYFTLFICTLIISRLIIAIKAFLNQYKKITRKNLIYLFNTNDKAVPRVVGKCKIICGNNKKRCFIATVVDHNNQIIDRVIVNKKLCERNVDYTLYELHGVYYVE
jgi:hypothetical protein